MSDKDEAAKNSTPEANPEMRRSVSRRGFLTGNVKRAGLDAVKQMPTIGGLLGFAFRETPGMREERLVTNLWQLLAGREPKSQELQATLTLVKNAKNPDEKADALVDIVWALCQTEEFEQLERSNSLLVRGFYRLALNREPRDEERQAALEILAEAADPAARRAALEGLFTGLIRSWESVLYQRNR